QSLIRAAVGQDCDSEPEQQAVAYALSAEYSRQSAKQQRTASCRNRASPVAVHPIADYTEIAERDPPPKNAHRDGIHACSIQTTAAHIAATLRSTPIQGWPSMIPSARTAPCAGGYIDE